MNKKIILAILVCLFAIPAAVFGQETSQAPNDTELIEARVVAVQETKEVETETGVFVTQQNLSLKGLNGDWKDKEFAYKGISEVVVAGGNVYSVGDKVLVQKTLGPSGEAEFYVQDFIRSTHLFWLAAVFALIIIAIGRWKGVKALIGLAVSFAIIIKGMLPLILNGTSPLLVGIGSAFLILTVIIYITEGFGKKSHLSVLSVFLSLLATLGLSVLFSGLARLTGMAQEETVFLLGVAHQVVDFRGLLLAGMLIGAIGVLDDVIVGQIEAVRQIWEANPKLSVKKVFGMAYKVGNTHLGAIVNTLFLTYAGASLPLLLLFIIKEEPFLTFTQVINNEIIATEIIRTLVGSVGVALSMPIATALGAYFLRTKESRDTISAVKKYKQQKKAGVLK